MWKDKLNKNIFYANNFSEKTILKIKKLLEKNKVDYVVVEDDVNIGYKTLNGNLVIKYMLSEIIKDILEKTKPKTEQISICVNKYNDENIRIIEDIARNTKSLNIVTNNEWFDQLERKLEKEEVFISVTNNKRTALKTTSIMINFDYDNLNEFNINRNMVIIDLGKDLKIPKSFNGIIIKTIDINTKKVIRNIAELDNFNRSKLIEAEIMNNKSYNKIREFIEMNKIYITNYKSRDIIKDKEFERIRKLNENVSAKKHEKDNN